MVLGWTCWEGRVALAPPGGAPAALRAGLPGGHVVHHHLRWDLTGLCKGSKDHRNRVVSASLSYGFGLLGERCWL